VKQRDLILSSGTLENPPLADVLEAARAGGYNGITLWPGDYHPARRGSERLAEMRARLDDAGLPLLDVDALIAWVGSDDPGPPYYEEAPEPEVFEMADALGAKGVNVLLACAPDASEAQAIDIFAGICERASAHNLQVHIEFSRGRIPCDIPSALELVMRSGAQNAGLMVDAWHVHWGTGSFDDLARAPGSLVSGVQLNDAPAETPADLSHATRYARRAPGEGCIDLAGVLRDLDKIASTAPLTVEVFDPAAVEREGVVPFACRLADAVRALR